MTTIAISKTEVAADGQRTWGGEIRGLDHEKLKVMGDIIYAFTGLAPLFQPMIDWHNKGALVADLPGGIDKDDGWTLVVISAAGICKYTQSCPYPEYFDAPIAFGAGADYAIGAMWHGATAEEAVSHVARHTNHTGGKITVMPWPVQAAPPLTRCEFVYDIAHRGKA